MSEEKNPYKTLDYKKLPFYGMWPRPLTEVGVFPDFLDEVKTYWKRKWGSQGIGRLKTVILHRPGEEAMLAAKMAKEDPAVAKMIMDWDKVDPEEMQREHDILVDILKGEGVEILWLNPEPPLIGVYGLPASYLCSCGWYSSILNGGAIGNRHGMSSWLGQNRFFRKRFAELNIPFLVQVVGGGLFECPNIRWIDNKTCIIATTSVTNMEGIEQVLPVMKKTGTEEVHIAHGSDYLYTYGDYGISFHLDGVFGMADDKLAVIYPGCIDYDTIRWLEAKKIDLIECPQSEYWEPCNLLCIELGKVIIAGWAEKTIKKLERKGVECIKWNHRNFALSSAGPTCVIGVLEREGSFPS